MYHIRFCIILFNGVTGFGLDVSETGHQHVKRDSIHASENNLKHSVSICKGKLIPETDIWTLHFKTWNFFFHIGIGISISFELHDGFLKG